jgi:hypothetical protein
MSIEMAGSGFSKPWRSMRATFFMRWKFPSAALSRAKAGQAQRAMTKRAEALREWRMVDLAEEGSLTRGPPPEAVDS